MHTFNPCRLAIALHAGRFAVATAIVLIAIGSPAASLADSPTAALRRANTRLNSLLRKKAKQGSQQAKRLESEIKAAVNQFLDFEELARLSLAKHWQKRTEKERHEFVEILRELIERNYIKQLRSHIDYHIDYQNESVDGKIAKVVTVASIKRDGRTDEAVIEYRMKKTPKGWMVYDVIPDDVSIVRNYRSQFNRIILRQSYQALVDKMKRKLETI
jgi:phospholipid transport system substrate-binding protein